ncbi:Mn2+/Fe2+ NRAMP family transporter [Dyadobacter jejuensis]|uniref:Mn2+/Fe2+ NRAMP family transporter n=1 Tax=Dyadobacter jejuensis TaxID=1082580 RepID=A0A316ARV6_9BACT|nr:Nramp family divalent metal transporter [Dyadobacter jejuensis]PWJ60059.1 Mn2+/Fe2+ NRAMP family transporter [Dyadobacter jejuensis]
MPKVLNPPTTFFGRLKYLGPGFILSAAIVGSGELIATTALGAKAGFITFWVILVSCLVKVALQLEFGKNAIYSGTFIMHNFNRLSGPRLKGTHWSIWLWLSLQGLKLLQVGGIVGGVAIVLHMVMPIIPVEAWALISVLLTSLILYRGNYGPVEKISLVLILLFTSVILTSLYLLQYTPYAITWEQVKSGLTFSLPTGLVAIAFGAFGITGVGGDEIMYYNYWCIEKGYATYTGPNDGSEAWNDRAKGWIKVMYLDAILSMCVYTVVTAAFYLLGAAVLHSQGQVPEGYQMIEVLSQIFTATLGPWAKILFLIGAFAALYSTLFTATASWARVWGDAFGQIGWLPFGTVSEKKRSIALFTWILPLIWAVLYLFMKAPVLMVVLGGIATSVLLLLIVYVAYEFRYRQLPKSLWPSRFYDVFFWLSVAAILMVSLYGVWKVVL